MLISKKELLAETGISYGQLYRWKREHLIPEEWFIKQSSFTGQETFFPKEQMLDRIRSIQELKDKYSLEELAKLLSPEIGESGFRMKDLEYLEEIDHELLGIFHSILGKEVVSYMEVLAMVILTRISTELPISKSQTSDMLLSMKAHLENMKSTGYIFAVFHKDSEYYSLIYQEQTPILIDDRFQIVKQIRMNDISNELKIKYRGKFNQEGNSHKNDQQDQQPEQTKRQQEDKNPQEDAEKHEENCKGNSKEEDFVIKINNWEVRL
jgi:DNA-binding transcriptional MerR regulator